MGFPSPCSPWKPPVCPIADIAPSHALQPDRPGRVSKLASEAHTAHRGCAPVRTSSHISARYVDAARLSATPYPPLRALQRHHYLTSVLGDALRSPQLASPLVLRVGGE